MPGLLARFFHSARQRPLLVTGTHRSGTTWIARTLEKSGTLLYLDEPLNLEYDGGSKVDEIQYWFQYVRPGDSAIVSQLRALNTTAIKQSRRALFKDPIGFFAIPAYVEVLHADVLISVRHPAAFAGSLKRLGWYFDFTHLLGQETLMQELLTPFHTAIEEMASRDKDIIGHAILLWNIIYHSAIRFKLRYPSIMLTRHEDLSARPLDNFKEICSGFAIPYNETMREYIAETTAPDNPAEVNANAIHQLSRDSAGATTTFRTRLDSDELARVKEETRTIASLFYTEQDW